VYHSSISFSFDPVILEHSRNIPKRSILLVIFNLFDIETWEDAKLFIENNPFKNTIIIGTFGN
jgi:hypothetical protein